MPPTPGSNACCRKLGWVGFDPTNRCLADERHLRIAVGRDYRDVSPTRGVLRGGESTGIEVAIKVSARSNAQGAGDQSHLPWFSRSIP